VFEGVWSGFTDNGVDGYCVTVGEFHNNLWRGYQTRCDASYPFGYATFLGSFVQLDATHVNLTYYFTDFHVSGAPALVGETLTFDLAVSNNGRLITMTLPGTGAVVHLNKVETMPTQQTVQITMMGSVATFLQAQQDAWIQDLAAALGIDARFINIVDIQSGSIIVTASIQDDSYNDMSSTEAAQMAASLTSIGSYTVTDVHKLSPAFSSSSQTVASFVLVVMLVVFAFLA